MKTKRNYAILLIIAVLVTLSFTSCSETEIASSWTSFKWEEVGEFTMVGNNLTPLKEINEDCNNVTVRIDEFSSPEPVIFHIQLVYEDDYIITDKLVLPASKDGSDITISGSVTKGDKIRIFTQVFKENGEYDPDLECTLSYSYMLQ